MQLQGSSDPTSLSYWLNWRVFVSAIWVLASILVASFLIWKYEHSDDLQSEEERTQQESSRTCDKSWKPCLKGIHPIFLMFFRLIAFCLLLVALTFDVAIYGFEMFYYYTQWTLTLVTIYFALGSLLSIHGCFHHHKSSSNNTFHASGDTEQGPYTPLKNGVNENRTKLLESGDHPGKSHILVTSRFWGYLFQILFQMTAGAVTITDLVYWCVIFPFLNLKDYQMNFLTVVAHSLNAILLLGDTAMNSLEFPWFRISYFLMLTSIYVIFQWVVHAFVSIWWPYPFLDLSRAQAPIWYLVVAVLHVPCYGIFYLVAKTKHFLLSKLLPHSYGRP